MSRKLPMMKVAAHGKHLVATEPLVFHCNYYNYFLQKTLLLDETLGMAAVIQQAASSCVGALLSRAQDELNLTTVEDRRLLASELFAELGFGLLRLDDSGPTGGTVSLPVSHYGRCLRQAAAADFAKPQSLFDAGYAQAALAAIHSLPPDAFAAEIEACQSQGAQTGILKLYREGQPVFRSPGQGAHTKSVDMPEPWKAKTSIDEARILAALATLDFSGNEEGLIPRFGVMLTHHFANFYNRISFEFVMRMKKSGMLEAAEDLLVEAGLRCAFHTLGGIMTSAEWDAVVRPQCQTNHDWLHGIIACVNALGWGVYRVHEFVPGERLVLRIYDDYESSGWIGMYGTSSRPISYLAQGAAAGMMNLVYLGELPTKPALDFEKYALLFEAPDRFISRQTRSLSMGDSFTEIVAERQ